MSSASALANIFRLPDLRKRIMLTLVLLLVYRLGFHIPLPGVDARVLKGFTEKLTGSNIWGIMNVVSGGRLQLPLLFSLGILPYISASIIFSLLVKVVPRLEALSKEGAAGQRKINQMTRYATVPICLVQGLVLVFTQFRNFEADVWGQNGAKGFIVPGLQEEGALALIGTALMLTVGMTAGTLFIMWLGEQITESGIGNGASLIIMAGILSSLPNAISKIGVRASDDRGFVVIAAVLVLTYLGVVIGVVMITKGQRRIPIQQAKLVRGGKVFGGAKHFLPIKVNMANVMPVIFASSLLMFPNIVSQAISGTDILVWAGWWYMVLETVLIFFFSFFWTSMMFQPSEMANNLKESGAFIPGIRPGKKTAEYLEKIMLRITIVGAAFLVLITIIPTMVAEFLKVDYQISSFLGGTSILIVVGVALDLVDKLNSQLLQRNYEGFMSAAQAKRGRRGQ